MYFFFFIIFFIYFRGRSVSSEHDNSESEHSEKSPLVKLDSLAKLLFSKSFQQDNGNTNKESDSPTRFCSFSFTFKNNKANYYNYLN